MGAGRPPTKFTQKDRDEIRELAALCMSIKDISIIKKCDENTLLAHCADELHQGKAAANKLVKGKFFTLINKKNPEPSAIYFYLKTQCQWRETSQLELSGKVEGPLQPIIEYVRGKKEPPPTGSV